MCQPPPYRSNVMLACTLRCRLAGHMSANCSPMVILHLVAIRLMFIRRNSIPLYPGAPPPAFDRKSGLTWHFDRVCTVAVVPDVGLRGAKWTGNDNLFSVSAARTLIRMDAPHSVPSIRIPSPNRHNTYPCDLLRNAKIPSGTAPTARQKHVGRSQGRRGQHAGLPIRHAIA